MNLTKEPPHSQRNRIALALEYPLLQQGGTEVLVRELLRGLSRYFEIVLVSGDVSRETLPTEYQELIAAHYSWNPRTSEQGRALAEAIRREGVRLAHFHFGGTYEWRSNRFWRCPVYHLARLGVPVLSTNHLVMEWLNCGVHPRRPFAYKLAAQAVAWFSRARVYQRLRLEVCVSKHDRARLVGMFPLFRGRIIQRYHSLLRANSPPPNLQPRQPVVLCVGTIGGRKAQPILVEAFGRIAGRHPGWRLDLVGRPGVAADMERIQAYVSENGLAERVQLPGWLSDQETEDRMKTASIFAIPSLQEGLGLSLQEALFQGCVAVGSRAGGIPELIDPEMNGLLVNPGDVADLSAALDRLISNPVLLEKMRQESRPSIIRKGMTAEAMLESYLALYRDLLQGAGIEAPGP